MSYSGTFFRLLKCEFLHSLRHLIHLEAISDYL